MDGLVCTICNSISCTENLVSAGNDPDESVRSAVIVTLQETALQDITCMTDKVGARWKDCNFAGYRWFPVSTTPLSK